MVLVKALPIGILHELLELPCNIGLHFRIFIVCRLISMTAFALALFLDPCETQLIGLQIANQLCQRNFVNIL